MTAGGERLHADVVGVLECLLVQALRRFDVAFDGADFGEQVTRIRRVGALVLLDRKTQCRLGELDGRVALA